ncbi:MAG TPA: glycoside hydrolase family 127 protein [Holophaga sp.]|nr:glycoside hydrolase family 127 protein [Holophaga sp.]
MTPSRTSRPAPLRNVDIHDAFWDRFTRLVREKVIPYQWEALNDRVPGAEKSHAIENFRIAAGLAEGKFHGYVFQDSDVAKWLEAVAYRLTTHPDPALEALADEVISIVAKTQQPDGYLDTYYLVAEPGRRWTDERRKHELYCAGHMMEAAVAYFDATGKRALLEVVCRLADHIATVFGPEPGKKHGYPGHQVIEMALVKLFHATGEARFLDLARYFIDERGKQPHFYDIEERERGEAGHKGYFEDYVYAYTQAHRPVREQDKAVGHAVRAVYLYSGMADVAMETGDASLAEACRTLWRNVTRRQMYVTGAIGSQEYGEDFTFDFDLPNDTMYAETCASIGLVFFAHRMLQMEPKGEYADVMERALYNGVLSGISMDGERFFYVNPLEVWPEACARRHDHGHVLPGRQPWFGCACCPPNLSRLVASIGTYIYTLDEESLWVHLFVGSTVDATFRGSPVRIVQETDYPHRDIARFTFRMERPTEFTLALRLPGWCEAPSIRINGEALDLAPLRRDGYARISRNWLPADQVELILPMPARRVWAHPGLRADAGLVAIQHGPTIYCLEEADHGADLAALFLPREAPLEVRYDPSLLGGTEVVEGEALRRVAPDEDADLYGFSPLEERPVRFRAVPYRLWGNRGPGEMRVWIHERS